MWSGAQGELKKARCQFSSERREGNGNIGTASGDVRGRILKTGKLKQVWRLKAMERGALKQVLSHACSPDHNQSLAEPECKPVPQSPGTKEGCMRTQREAVEGKARNPKLGREGFKTRESGTKDKVIGLHTFA